MKKRRRKIRKNINPKAKKSIFAVILISIIIILALIIGYGIYMGYKIKAEVTFLNNQVNQLSEERDNLISERDNLKTDLDNLQEKYGILILDIQKIYKSCITENACKGHLPGVTWYCNNIGDEVSDPSHTCICDSSCNMKATEIPK